MVTSQILGRSLAAGRSMPAVPAPISQQTGGISSAGDEEAEQSATPVASLSELTHRRAFPQTGGGPPGKAGEEFGFRKRQSSYV
jgi:hypothetical protein